MRLEKGKLYRTRAGALVEILSDPNSGGARQGAVYRTGRVLLTMLEWLPSGRRFSNRESENDLVAETSEPFHTWMCQVGDQSPMPAPNEQVAREWARRAEGRARAFRVMEIIE